jgi:hypothetical protein
MDGVDITGGTFNGVPIGNIPIYSLDGDGNVVGLLGPSNSMVLRVAYLNNIGTPGGQGFGVGICPSTLPAGMSEMSGCRDPSSANYGNYQYSDGSVMCWIPAFYYKWGTGSNGVALNEVGIKPESAYLNVTAANADGYALHRAFYDGGAVQPGVFVDKYLASYTTGGIASSIKNGIVLSSAARGTLSNEVFSDLTGAPAATLGGAIAAAKTRGSSFFCSSRFIFSALAMLAYAHGQASVATTYCAWYHATNNFPKGANNNALGDAQDADILYVNDGNGTYAGAAKTGSANLFARTTHNGQNSGVCDLNGNFYEFTPGLTSNGTNYFLLNSAVAMKNVTGSNTLATDLFGATGLAAMYTDLGTTYGAITKSGGWKYFGAATQVFSEATSGTAWAVAGCGIPLLAGTGGTNAFGNDGLYDPTPAVNEMAFLSSGGRADSSYAGVWCADLSSTRPNSSPSIGFRSALYL